MEDWGMSLRRVTVGMSSRGFRLALSGPFFRSTESAILVAILHTFAVSHRQSTNAFPAKRLLKNPGWSRPSGPPPATSAKRTNSVSHLPAAGPCGVFQQSPKLNSGQVRTPSRPIPEPPSGGPVAADLKSNYLLIAAGPKSKYLSIKRPNVMMLSILRGFRGNAYSQCLLLGPVTRLEVSPPEAPGTLTRILPCGIHLDRTRP